MTSKDKILKATTEGYSSYFVLEFSKIFFSGVMLDLKFLFDIKFLFIIHQEVLIILGKLTIILHNFNFKKWLNLDYIILIPFGVWGRLMHYFSINGSCVPKYCYKTHSLNKHDGMNGLFVLFYFHPNLNTNNCIGLSIS